MRIRLGLIPGTRLILAGFINRPKEAESSNPANDLVETTSPGHHSCSAQSGLVETTSPGPRQGLAKALLLSYCFSHRPVEVIPPCQQFRLSLKEEHSPSLRVAATRCSIARSPDLVLEVGLEPPAADLTFRIPCEDQRDADNSTSRIPHEDLPPVILEIPSGSPDLEEELHRVPESHQRLDTPGKWFRPPTRSPPRSRSSSPPSPRRPRKCSSSFGRWCE